MHDRDPFYWQARYQDCERRLHASKLEGEQDAARLRQKIRGLESHAEVRERYVSWMEERLARSEAANESLRETVRDQRAAERSRRSDTLSLNAELLDLQLAKNQEAETGRLLKLELQATERGMRGLRQGIAWLTARQEVAERLLGKNFWLRPGGKMTPIPNQYVAEMDALRQKRKADRGELAHLRDRLARYELRHGGCHVENGPEPKVGMSECDKEPSSSSCPRLSRSPQAAHLETDTDAKSEKTSSPIEHVVSGHELDEPILELKAGIAARNVEIQALLRARPPRSIKGARVDEEAGAEQAPARPDTCSDTSDGRDEEHSETEAQEEEGLSWGNEERSGEGLGRSLRRQIAKLEGDYETLRDDYRRLAGSILQMQPIWEQWVAKRCLPTEQIPGLPSAT